MLFSVEKSSPAKGIIGLSQCLLLHPDGAVPGGRRTGQLLARRVFDLAREASLTKDLKLTEADFEINPSGTVDAIHNWMSEL